MATRTDSNWSGIPSTASPMNLHNIPSYSNVVKIPNKIECSPQAYNREVKISRYPMCLVSLDGTEPFFLYGFVVELKWNFEIHSLSINSKSGKSFASKFTLMVAFFSFEGPRTKLTFPPPSNFYGRPNRRVHLKHREDPQPVRHFVFCSV